MWNPDVYLAFADHRGRPYFDLLSRVGAEKPRRVVDLGCGPGNLTVTLSQRWPDAAIEAWDSSPEMVELAAGAWIAMQVPGNFDAPSHRAVRELARRQRWAEPLRDFPFREGQVDSPVGYAELLANAGCTVDAWETTYVHELTGENPVLEWVTGTALRPVRSRLTDEQWEQFRVELIPLLDDAYPVRPDGRTFFPFRRIFVVAQVN
jgi:trans-aconitate 2-methyltransferase